MSKIFCSRTDGRTKVITIQGVLMCFVKNAPWLNTDTYLVPIVVLLHKQLLFNYQYPLYSLYSLQLSNRDIVVGITTRLRFGRSLVWISLGEEIFFSLLLKGSSQRLLGPPNFLSMVIGVRYPGLKRPGRGVNHSLSYNTKVKNEWSYTSASPTCIHGVNKENCTYIPFLSS